MPASPATAPATRAPDDHADYLAVLELAGRRACVGGHRVRSITYRCLLASAAPCPWLCRLYLIAGNLCLWIVVLGAPEPNRPVEGCAEQTRALWVEREATHLAGVAINLRESPTHRGP